LGFGHDKIQEIGQMTLLASISMPTEPLNPARRLALLREICEGRHVLRAGPSADAQAAWAAKLAEWSELDRLRDIRVRTFEDTTECGEGVRAAIAVMTLSGMKYLEQHASEPYD
jgi:hypothetical protein